MKEQNINTLSPAKALAILGYGESVAAYRYRTLADRAPTAQLQAVMEEMADEEQGHHERIRELLEKHFPGSDFVLTAEDKERVTVGQRLLNLSAPDFFNRAILEIQESERRTGRFYARLHESPPHPELKAFLKEMADECFEHADRLDTLITS